MNDSELIEFLDRLGSNSLTMGERFTIASWLITPMRKPDSPIATQLLYEWLRNHRPHDPPPRA